MVNILKDGRCNCLSGFYGTKCANKCPQGFYGHDCSLICQCLHDEFCEPDGTCKKIKCPSGRTGKNCDEGTNDLNLAFI